MSTFDFKSATPVTTGVTSSFFWFGAASQAAATPSIYSMGALTNFLSTSTLATGTITTSQPLTLTQTWNSGAVGFVGMLINITDTACDISTSFPLRVTSPTHSGVATSFSVRADGYCFAGNGFADLQETIALLGSNIGLQIGSAAPISWSSTGNYFGTKDLFLVRDAANTLAQRNGTTAQAFNLYNTYTSGSNYQRVELTYSATANIAILQTNSATATATELWLQSGSAAGGLIKLQPTASAGSIQFGRSGIETYWTMSASGFLAGTDNTYDIGASGATRPRNVYVGTAVIAAGNLTSTAGSLLAQGGNLFLNNCTMAAASDGVIKLGNAAASDINRVCWGGTTSSFPALKRSSAALVARLADDSADCDLTAANITASTSLRINQAPSAVGTGVKTISNISDSSTNFGHYFSVNLNGTTYYIPCSSVAPT